VQALFVRESREVGVESKINNKMLNLLTFQIEFHAYHGAKGDGFVAVDAVQFRIQVKMSLNFFPVSFMIWNDKLILISILSLQL
jgi:hypothetical protein